MVMIGVGDVVAAAMFHRPSALWRWIDRVDTVGKHSRRANRLYRFRSCVPNPEEMTGSRGTSSTEHRFDCSTILFGSRDGELSKSSKLGTTGVIAADVLQDCFSPGGYGRSCAEPVWMEEPRGDKQWRRVSEP
ncbi:hypothetical protein ZHAS_00006416 [Anopheles sinensis]|uniref:Uncharacterized protein n=1 Tax=Anopheles sinensis TaxID=74873 RepID=A0A084VLX4_ANOSI|nr:hypothetical protein ZHAS_00006416 [Anopheles sinensis]